MATSASQHGTGGTTAVSQHTGVNTPISGHSGVVGQTPVSAHSGEDDTGRAAGGGGVYTEVKAH